jgi:hypothetical protein
VRRQCEELTVQRAKYVEKRPDAEDVKAYCASITADYTSLPSEFFWNADETCVGSAKHMLPPDLILASGTKQGSVTVLENRDDSELTLRTAISAAGDSTDPYFISTNKIFERTALHFQQLFEGHDHRIRTAAKTFIARILFMDWTELVVLVRINELRQNEDMQAPYSFISMDTRHT